MKKLLWVDALDADGNRILYGVRHTKNGALAVKEQVQDALQDDELTEKSLLAHIQAYLNAGQPGEFYLFFATEEELERSEHRTAHFTSSEHRAYCRLECEYGRQEEDYD